MTNNFVFEADLAAKKIHMVREFNAPIEKVWKAFTDRDLLEKWMAPKPWIAKIKVWDFTVGGKSLYVMTNPEGHKHWVYSEFTGIENGSAIATTGMFCDGDGNPLTDGPKTYRDTKFTSIDGNRSQVDSVITFTDESNIKWFVEGGFKEGTAMTFILLDELLDSVGTTNTINFKNY